MEEVIISFVIIEYYSISEIKKAIETIGNACNNISYEIVISSNSCYSKKDQNILKRDISNVLWVFNEKNGGFAYGINRGLKLSRGKFIVIMNPDVLLSNSLIPITKFLDDNPDVGAIAPMIVDNNGEVQDSCRHFVTPLNFIKRQIIRLVFHKESIVEYEMQNVQTVDFLIGAFIMIRKEVLTNIGYLDEEFFMYAEDMDWCARIWKGGYKVVFYPKIKIIYKGSRSARRKYKFALIFLLSHCRYWIKNGFFSLNEDKIKIYN